MLHDPGEPRDVNDGSLTLMADQYWVLGSYDPRVLGDQASRRQLRWRRHLAKPRRCSGRARSRGRRVRCPARPGRPVGAGREERKNERAGDPHHPRRSNSKVGPRAQLDALPTIWYFLVETANSVSGQRQNVSATNASNLRAEPTVRATSGRCPEGASDRARASSGPGGTGAAAGARGGRRWCRSRRGTHACRARSRRRSAPAPACDRASAGSAPRIRGRTPGRRTC